MEVQQKNKSRWIYLIIAVIAIISLGSAFFVGGVTGYFIGRGTVRRVIQEGLRIVPPRLERILPPQRMPSEPVPPEPELPPEKRPTERPPEKLAFEYGAIIRWVEEDGPAAKAGLQEGDIIVAVNGKPLSEDRDLSAHIQAFKPGDRVELRILRPREGQGHVERSVEVTLGKRRDEQGRTVAYLGIKYSTVPGRMFIEPAR